MTGEGGRANVRAGLRLPQMLTLRDQTDRNGRLLLEDSASKRAQKEVKRAGVPMRTTRAPYEDTPSRHGGLMNASAYEALRHDTGEVLDGFAWLTRHYLRLDPSRRSTVRGVFDVANMGLTLPLVLFHRATHPVPPHRALPSPVASLFKASRGVFSAAVDMVNKKGPETVVTAWEFVAFADQEGHLRRQETQRVCAAPTRLIERTIAVILTGEGADADRSRLPELVEFERLWDFHSRQERFSDALSRYRFLLDRVLEAGPAGDPRELLHRPVPEMGPGRTFGDLTESVLAHADQVQGELNLLLGRSGDVAPITYEELLRLL
jgi:hypothetical protein